MRKGTIITALACLVISLATPCTAATDRIEIVVPSVEDEIEYVWRTLQDVSFFADHGYEISLPDDPLVEALVEKSKRNALENSDRARFEQLMRNKIYDRDSYQIALAKIESRKPLINDLINRLDKIEMNWSYRRFGTYQVKLTLYGPGGSFGPGDGSILIFTTPNGSFKQYEDPACTIVHEVVHIGIEESIVVQFGVPHSLKERVVDRIVQLAFKDELPEYRIQNMGYEELDNHLNDLEDIKNLSRILEGFLNERRR